MDKLFSLEGAETAVKDRIYGHLFNGLAKYLERETDSENRFLTTDKLLTPYVQFSMIWRLIVFSLFSMSGHK